MYQPKKFKKEDPSFIFKFIQEHPFATFVLQGEQLLATHIPVLVEGSPEDFRLYGHIANHNEQYQYLKDGAEALLIFKGPDGYVSSSWYQEKDISTWDYSAVHVNVKLKLQSRKELEDSLDHLIAHFEKQQENPLLYKELPRQMVEDHLPLITGFWCEPVRIQAVAKLHQNYGEKDVQSVVEHLKDREDSCPLAKDIEKEHE
ncbi:protease synthase and sporulation protein PAI 2 [Salinimicrobium marinum]|uniref:Protease synthase and sporulation protein PAI 2 n=1 Tax=Salinimicrobium marinum TaxID=680283 RepID=A0A918W169_9FLAO|nr:FMN-binding negative transcriptional regulator [Salinimicrobium marinum]GHA43333.1 protease synthase and sporulation protein PAI 2 [Salinimicrobium marinum]